MTYQLLQSATAVADSTGTATTRLGPRRAFENWHVTGVQVLNTSTVLEPKARVYQGAVAPSNFIGGTYSGRQDGGAEDKIIFSGQDIIAQWTGADVGSTSTLIVTGEIQGT